MGRRAQTRKGRPREAEAAAALPADELLERARRRILDCNGGKPPRLLDPFAGGGAIPLEALRLGCEVEASDLNPVAVLILKGTVEYPQKYGRPLAEQCEQKARGERESIAGVDGEVPSYIRRRREVDGQSCFGESDLVAAYRKNPLADRRALLGQLDAGAGPRRAGRVLPARPGRQHPGGLPLEPDRALPELRRRDAARSASIGWPATDTKKVALQPVIDRETKRVDFEVVEGPSVTGDPGEATTSRGDTMCFLCRQVVKAEYVRGAEGGKIGAMHDRCRPGGQGTAAASATDAATEQDTELATDSRERTRPTGSAHDGDLPRFQMNLSPNDPRNIDVEYTAWITWGSCSIERQFSHLRHLHAWSETAHVKIVSASGVDAEYAKAVATYLGLVIGPACGH